MNVNAEKAKCHVIDRLTDQQSELQSRAHATLKKGGKD